jgi:very-short-patch-repair endonuclease
VGLSASQQGLVTRDQLVGLGRSKHQIDHALTTQRLSLVYPGIYRMGGSALTDDSALTAALLFTKGVASHRSAAHLLGLIEPPPCGPELIIDLTRSQRTAGLILHRSRDLTGADICRIRGLRCTTATRTLIDVGAVVSEAVLESALERALHQRMTTVPRLQRRLDQVARRGRPGVKALREVLELRTPHLDAAESELELLIWRILRRHHVPLQERQVALTVDGCDFRLDMAYTPERIFIEGDGFGVHSTRSAFESDRFRQNKLVVAGWLPLLFTWRRARTSEDEIAAQVQDAIAMRRKVSAAPDVPFAGGMALATGNGGTSVYRRTDTPTTPGVSDGVDHADRRRASLDHLRRRSCARTA